MNKDIFPDKIKINRLAVCRVSKDNSAENINKIINFLKNDFFTICYKKYDNESVLENVSYIDVLDGNEYFSKNMVDIPFCENSGYYIVQSGLYSVTFEKYLMWNNIKNEDSINLETLQKQVQQLRARKPFISLNQDSLSK